VSSIQSPVALTVLQHVRETTNAKNTVRLLRLAIEDVTLCPVGNDDDLSNAMAQFENKQCAVFFPNQSSKPIEQHTACFKSNHYHSLLFIDGNWKQAAGIAKKLSHYPNIDFYHFAAPPKSQYVIRHTSIQGALSTLEAVALALYKGYQIPVEPLLTLQNAFQNMWQGPVEHRRKFQQNND